MRLPRWVPFVRTTVLDDEEEARKRFEVMETRQPQRHFPHECQKKIKKSSYWAQQQQQRLAPAVSLLWWWQPSSFYWFWTQLLVGSVTNRIVVSTLPTSLLGHNQISLFAYSWIGCLTYNSKYVPPAAPLSTQRRGGVSSRTTIDFLMTTKTTNACSNVDATAKSGAVATAEHHDDVTLADEANNSVNISLIDDDDDDDDYDDNDLVFYWSRDPSLRVEESDDSIAADAECDDPVQIVNGSDPVDEKVPQVLSSDILDSSKETTTRLESPKGVLDEFIDALATMESNRYNQVEEMHDVSNLVPNLDESYTRSLPPAILRPHIEDRMEMEEEKENFEVIVTAAGEATFEVQYISKQGEHHRVPPSIQTPQEPPHHAPDIDVASHVYNGAKGIWGWSKSHVPLAGIFLGVTEGVANAVVRVTAGCDLSQVDQQHIQPHLQNFDAGLLNPVLHAIVETVLDESDKLEHQDPGERNLLQHILAPLVCPPVGFLKDRFQENEGKPTAEPIATVQSKAT